MTLTNAPSTPSIRLMTYNIHRWEGKDQRLDIARLAHVIASAGPDLVGLNEVLHPVSDGQRSYEPLRALAECLGMHFVFGPSGWMDYGPTWHGRVGNAILCRHPLANVSNVHLPKALSSKQRSLLGATVASGPGAGLSLYVTHLDHLFEGTRLLQLIGLLARVSPQGPHFVAGDFNTPGFQGKHSRRLLPPVLRYMRRSGYEDAFDAVGVGCGRTFPAATPLFRLDYLFLPHRWAHGLRTAYTPDFAGIEHASDHRPVLVEWAWPDGASTRGTRKAGQVHGHAVSAAPRTA